MSSRQPGRRIPSKSHGMRAPGPSGRPPVNPPAPAADGVAAAPPPADPGSGTATPATGTTPTGTTPTSTTTVRPGSRSANRAAKRAATTGVRPKTQLRKPAKRSSNANNTGLIVLAAIAVVGLAALIIVANPFGSASASPGASDGAVATRLLTGCPTEAPAGLAAGEKRTVTLATTKGDIVIEVSADLAPVAAANFVALAECGFYDGVIFHRVIPDFMIQGGDGQYAWTGGLDAARAGQGGPGYEFADEPVNGSYSRGTVAMANGGADTNGSQFFIMVKDSTTLPKDYVIFGQVTAGMDVADQIVAGPRDANDFPDDPVAITSATVAPLAASTPSAAPTTAPSAAPASPSAAPAS
ncbi:MAG TPA: peptidylprolyl isomerase [Candidatus Limnocylindrales bacterium]|nr:peptidylprolyl isomerase [Candidatus Limnocylindrales bacterium]